MARIPKMILIARRAAEYAEELIRQLNITDPPVDPLAIVESERGLLIARGDNFRERFDGQLEYHPEKRRFLLLFNTKYDRGDRMHPRTRFSISHELGHYFIEEHHTFLRRGGALHKSRGEFVTPTDMEREADAFAAALLMPTTMIRPRVNECELSIKRITELATVFDTSLVSTAIRATLCSDFPTAIIGLRDGTVAWQFQSQCLVESGCYAGERGPIHSSTACEAWEQFSSGAPVRSSGAAYIREWFRTFDKDHLDHRSVVEEYLAVPSMGTLIVLLTVSEEELYDCEDDDG